MEKTATGNKIATSDDAGIVYEISYLLLPGLDEGAVSAKAIALKGIITSTGGSIISDENPVLIDLAYSMIKVVQTAHHKVNSGYFGWMKFEMPQTPDSAKISGVKKAFDADTEIVRYLLIKTVRENTLLNGKMKLQKEEKVKRVSENEVEEEVPIESVKNVSAEEIDKSIDDLVIV